MIEIGYIVRATLACNPAVNHDRVASRYGRRRSVPNIDWKRRDAAQ